MPKRSPKCRSKVTALFSISTRRRRLKQQDAAERLFQLPRSPSGNGRRIDCSPATSGGGMLIVSTAVAQCRAIFVLTLTLVVTGPRFVTASYVPQTDAPVTSAFG